MSAMTTVVQAAAADPTEKLIVNTLTSLGNLATNVLDTLATETVAAISASVTGNHPASQKNATAGGKEDMKKKYMAEKKAQEELNVDMGYWLMYALAGVMGLAILMALPRFLARFYASVQPRNREKKERNRPNYAFESGLNEKMAYVEAGPRHVAGGDLWTGWFLRSGRPGSNGRRARKDDQCCGDSIPNIARSHLAPPPHSRQLTSRLPFGWIWTAAPLSNMPSIFYTAAETRMLVMVALYLFFCFGAMFWKCDLSPSPIPRGPRYNFKRSGVIAMTQVPIAIAFGVRGNIPGMLIGKSYDHLRIIHKVSGRVMFFAGAFHSIGYLVSWGKAGKLLTTTQLGITGYVAFAGICLIAVTSLPYIRRVAYGVFKASHVLGILMLVIGLYFHHDSCPPWMLVSGALYVFSVVLGFAKTRVASAEIQALGGTTHTLVTIPSITTGWRAGQHVRIRIMGLGLLSAECHPFTIANAPDTPGGMTLLVKAAGDWTTRLYETASSGGAPTHAQAETGVWKRQCKIILEGPYGGLGNTLTPTFSSVVLIAGGSGITHSLSVAEDLIQRSPSGVVATRTIDLIWVVRVEQVARALMPTLNALVARAKAWESHALNGRRQGADFSLPCALRVHIFVTRVPKSSPLTLLGAPRLARSNTNQTVLNHVRFNEKEELAHVDVHSAPSSSNGHSSDNGHADTGFYAYNNSSDDYVIRPDLSSSSSAAQQTKADWLARNPSQCTIRSLHQRQTDWTEPMSSISAYRGRPDLKASISTIVDETIARHGRSITDPRGLFAAACGPEFLVNDSRDACQAVSEWKKAAVRGVEFESEFFGI